MFEIDVASSCVCMLDCVNLSVFVSLPVVLGCEVLECLHVCLCHYLSVHVFACVIFGVSFCCLSNCLRVGLFALSLV